jgi:homoserine kinase
MELLERAHQLGALGATISGAGPTVMFWTQYEQTSVVYEALHAEAEGWATVMRAPFESQGAWVRAL